MRAFEVWPRSGSSLRREFDALIAGSLATSGGYVNLLRPTYGGEWRTLDLSFHFTANPFGLY